MTEVMTETELQQLAERGAAELEGAGADELLRWTDENFGGNYIVASNMQDAVLVDLAAKVRPGVDVLFLDTGYHFVETIGTRDAVEAVYDINVVNVTPENNVAKQDELYGKDLFGYVSDLRAVGEDLVAAVAVAGRPRVDVLVVLVQVGEDVDEPPVQRRLPQLGRRVGIGDRGVHGRGEVGPPLRRRQTPGAR